MAETVAAAPVLKDINGKRLFAVLALNVVVFFLLQGSAALGASDWPKLVAGWISAWPAAAGVALVGILNNQISSDAKARLVFWRWRNPYPGSAAFTRHGPQDARVDMAALESRFGPLPVDPKDQNTLWYRMYRAVAHEPAVLQAHRNFLFARDYALLAIAMLAVLGTSAGVNAGLLLHPATTATIYVLLLVLQWGLAIRAANVSGHRFVTTVLALTAARKD